MSSPSSSAAVERIGPFKRLYLWVLSWAETRYGTPALFVLSFAESSFFPVPPDVLQIALSVGKPKRSFFYAAVSAVGSVLGGVLGWYIGFALWESLSGFFFEYIPGVTAENFEKVRVRYDDHAFFAIFGAAFTPIPFKVFTIASGVFEVALGTLILASALGRSLRFMLVAAAIFFFGPAVKDLLDKYFAFVTFALLALLIAGFAVIKFLI